MFFWKLKLIDAISLNQFVPRFITFGDTRMNYLFCCIYDLYSFCSYSKWCQTQQLDHFIHIEKWELKSEMIMELFKEKGWMRR